MKTVVIEICGSVLVDDYTDDPVFVLLVDWDTGGYELGDCYIRKVKNGGQDRLVLAVPGYPTVPLSGMPEGTRTVVEQVASDLMTPAEADTTGEIRGNR